MNPQLNGDIREWARMYAGERRWSVIPIGARSKQPLGDAWQDQRLTVGDIDQKFRSNYNVGVLLGEPSGDLVDIDLDREEGARIADAILPETACIFGRPSKPCSHRLYRVSGVGKTEKYLDPIAKAANGKHAMIVELRANGGQTVLPGSHHEGTGELIEFTLGADGEPAEVSYSELHDALNKLAAAALLAHYWDEGKRHDAALALSGMLAHGGWQEEDIAFFVEQVAIAAQDEQIEERVRAALDTAQHFASGEPTTGTPTLETLFDVAVVRKVRQWLGMRKTTKTTTLTADLDNARRLAATYGHVVRHSGGKWYAWDGLRWKLDEAEHVVRGYAAAIVDQLRSERRDKGTVDAGNVRRIKGMLEIAATLGPIFLPAGMFDQRGDLYNCPNGTLELDHHTGEVRLREHRQEDMLTMISSTAYRPEAADSLPEKLHEYLDYFVVRQLDDGSWERDQEVLDFLFEMAGHTLTGYPKREAALLQGPTNAGKSMWLALLRNSGGDYAKPLAYTSLAMDRRPHPGSHRDDIASIEGSRVVTISEIPERFEPDAALFKLMLSGGDAGRYRGMWERSRDIVFTHTIWIATNPDFELPAADESAYERVFKVRFPRTRPATDRDSNAARELVEDPAVLEAFLALSVQGFTRLYSRKDKRLTPPESVRTATKEMRLAVDPFAMFFEDCCEFDVEGDSFVRGSELWREVRAYFERHHLRRLRASDRESFEKSVERHGARRAQSRAIDGNNPVWVGMRFSEEQHWAPLYSSSN